MTRPRTLPEAEQDLGATERSLAVSDVLAQTAAAIELRENLIEDLISRLVELWHMGYGDDPIQKFIGLTDEQYAAYVECRYDDLVQTDSDSPESPPKVEP